jgi:hypothetical protein
MQNAFVRVVVSLSIVGMAFLFNVALGFDNSFQAQAEPYTPEATQYQVNSNESRSGRTFKRKLMKSLRIIKIPKQHQKPLKRLETA